MPLKEITNETFEYIKQRATEQKAGIIRQFLADSELPENKDNDLGAIVINVLGNVLIDFIEAIDELSHAKKTDNIDFRDIIQVISSMLIKRGQGLKVGSPFH